jgi:hypothetical protein
MIENKLIERVVEYVPDEMPWSPSKIIVKIYAQQRRKQELAWLITGDFSVQ